MEKIKVLDYVGGRMTIDTTVRTGNKTLELHGEPTVVVFNEYIQVGCMRMTKEGIELLYRLSRDMGHIERDGNTLGITFQQGDYETKDPNTKSLVP